MATETDPKKMSTAGNQQQQPPPGYYVTSTSARDPHWSGYHAASGPSFHTPGSYPQHIPVTQCASPPTTTVTVTQPLIAGNGNQTPGPDTTCALVMSTLSAIFCGFWCGAVAIMLAWKARMQVLDKKYDHAAHSLKIVWLFFFLALLFGVAIWAMLGIVLYFYFVAAYVYYYG